jgi:uncharacterized protein (TIGR02391 family)
MTSRTAALIKILDEIEEFQVPLNPYYDDIEPQGVIDNILSGKINSLIAFLKIFGWAELLSLLQDITPLRGNAVEALDLVQSVVIPEARRLAESANTQGHESPISWFWEFVHPRIRALAKPRYEAGFFGDAVEASFKEVNESVKKIVVAGHGKELDGAALMTTAFSLQTPLIKLSALTTESDRSIQQGYMQIFAGSMIGIRNPKAHGNLNPDSNKTLHLIALASLLMSKIDDRVE